MTAPVTGVQRSRATVPQDREDPWDKAHREGRRDRMDQGDKQHAAAGAVAADRLAWSEHLVVIGAPAVTVALIPTGVGSTTADPDRRGSSSVEGGCPGSSRPIARREASKATAR